jgi:hypothetical protein
MNRGQTADPIEKIGVQRPEYLLLTNARFVVEHQAARLVRPEVRWRVMPKMGGNRE